MKLYEINEEIDRLTDTIYVDEETGEVVGDITEICEQIDALQMEKKKDTGGSSDTFAGESNKPIDRLQIVVK